LISSLPLIKTIPAAIYHFHKESEEISSFKVQEDTMQRFTRLSFIVLVVAVLFTFGCAAKKVCTVTKPCTTKLSNYDCLEIDQFIYSQAFRETKINDAGDEMKASILRDGLVTRVHYHIYTLSLFQDVVTAECPDDAEKIVVLKGEITYLKRVTNVTRFLAGAMAGRARVDVDIHLVDSQTGEEVGYVEKW
jgi:hypothetical protein